MFDPKDITVEDLRGGRIAEIIGAAPAGRGEELLDAVEHAFGARPPAELGEYAAAEAAALARVDGLVHRGGWLFSLELYDLSQAHDEPLADPMMLLCGLARIGSHDSGDSAFVSVLPHPDDVAEVWVYDHELGEISRRLGHSTTHALLSARFDDEVPEYGAPGRERPDYLLGDVLYRRARWLVGLLAGEPARDFAASVADAPDYDTWLAERDAAREHPHLAVYWMFAHYFLGNVEGCREAIEIAAERAGTVGAKLADQLRAVLEDRHAGVGRLTAARLRELQTLVYVNAAPEQIDPMIRAAIAAERGEVRADRDAIAARLAEGATPMELIERYPDDVELHDELLTALGEEWVDEYFTARTGSIHDQWPAGDTVLDPRLSRPVAAAFRAGLRHGASHERAFAGLTRTLPRCDPEHSMVAYRQAIDRLRADDRRLERVIAQLAQSDHPDAHATLVRGARRYFEQLEGLRTKPAAPSSDWPSLDEMFGGDDYLVGALLHAMRPTADLDEQQRDDVEMLARKTLEQAGALATLGTAWAHAMRVVAAYELHDLGYLARGYVETFRDNTSHEQAEELNDDVMLNLIESARAWALLDPEGARPIVRELAQDYPALAEVVDASYP